MQLNEQIKALRNYNKALHTLLCIELHHHIYTNAFTRTTKPMKIKMVQEQTRQAYGLTFFIGRISIHYPHQNRLYK